MSYWDTLGIGNPDPMQGTAAPGFTFDAFLHGMTPDQFNNGADAGVNYQSIFDGLRSMGANEDQLKGFAPWLAQNFQDPSGQFGKYAQGQTVADNLQKYLQGDTNYQQYGADRGSGGWLTDHFGDIVNWATNPLDAATGNHMSSFAGRLGGQLYDNTFGNLGGWAGEHLFGDSGIASNYTRHLMNMAAGAAMPGGEAITNGYRADYENARQRGLSPGEANRLLGTNAVTSAAALVGGGLLSGAGAGGVAGTGLSTGSGLADTAANSAIVGGLRGGATSAINGGNIGRGALTGAATGAVGSGVGGATSGALGGGALGSIAGHTLGGAASGVVGSAMNGGSIGQGAATGAIGGLASSAGGALAGRGGAAFGDIAGGLLNRSLFAPNRNNPQGGGLPLGLLGAPNLGPGLRANASAYVPQIDPRFAALYGADQSQSLLSQMRFPQPPPISTQFPLAMWNPGAPSS